MTHTLHRVGSPESLGNEYLVLIMRSKKPPKRAATRKGSGRRPKLKTFVTKTITSFLDANPTASLRIEKMLLSLPRLPRILARAENLALRLVLRPLVLFDNLEDLTTFLGQLKKKNIGASVVVSGLFQNVNLSLKRIGLCPHTVQFSLGVFGKVEKLPNREILEITTMCGHHLISPRLVEKLVTDVSKKRIDSRKAAQMLSKQCLCKAFNETRATALIEGFSARVLEDRI